jgi:RNA-binding protein
MLTGKQRAYLKSLAQTEDTIIIVGKNGVNEEVILGTENALKARELVKGKTLETAPESTETSARKIADRAKAEIVQIIGNKFVLYKRNHQNPKIELPKQSRKVT